MTQLADTPLIGIDAIQAADRVADFAEQLRNRQLDETLIQALTVAYCEGMANKP